MSVTLDALLTRVRKAATWTFLGAGVGQVFDLISVALLAHGLGLRAFGVFITARAAAGLVNALAGARSWDLFYAYWTKFNQNGNVSDANRMYGLANALELSLSALGVAIVATLGFTTDIVPADLSAIPAVVLVSAFSRYASANLINVNQAVFRLQQAYRISALQAALGPLIRLTSIGMMILVGRHDLTLLAFLDGASGLMSWFIGAAIVHHRWHMQPVMLPKALLRSHGREFWRFSSWNWSSGSVKGANANIPELMLAALAGPEAVGMYGLARRLAMFVAAMLDPMLQAIAPEVYRLVADKDRATLFAFFRRISALAAVIVVTISAVAILWGRHLVYLAGGEAFRDAAAPLTVIVLGLSLQFALGWLRPLMLALMAPKSVLLAEASMAIVLLSLGTICIPAWGALGAALAVLGGYIIQNGLLGVLARRRLRQP